MRSSLLFGNLMSIASDEMVVFLVAPLELEEARRMARLEFWVPKVAAGEKVARVKGVEVVLLCRPRSFDSSNSFYVDDRLKI